jgi:hypothetical protein
VLDSISEVPEIEMEKEAEIQKFKEKDFAEFQRLKEEFCDLFYESEKSKIKRNLLETSKKIKTISNAGIDNRNHNRETYKFDAISAYFKAQYDLENEEFNKYLKDK